MNVTKQYRVQEVRYQPSGGVQVTFTTVLVDETNAVVASIGGVQVNTDQATVGAGVTGNWGDADVERACRAATQKVAQYTPIPENERVRGGPTERQELVDAPMLDPAIPIGW